MATEHETGLVVCVTGPESTGKTTLAQALAAHFDAPLVEEVARAWLAGQSGYDAADVLRIAREQVRAEQAALATGASLIIADTDLTVIRVWWEERYGTLDPWISTALGRRSPRRYLLMMPDLPWVADPLRESPHDRERLLERYRAGLAGDGFPFAEVSGLDAARFERALVCVDQWLER